jgi:hypothetical protein
MENETLIFKYITIFQIFLLIFKKGQSSESTVHSWKEIKNLRSGGRGQETEHLLSKWGAMSSNPRTAQKKKERKKKRERESREIRNSKRSKVSLVYSSGLYFYSIPQTPMFP